VSPQTLHFVLFFFLLLFLLYNQGNGMSSAFGKCGWETWVHRTQHCLPDSWDSHQAPRVARWRCPCWAGFSGVHLLDAGAALYLGLGSTGRDLRLVLPGPALGIHAPGDGPH
jgi:hypothetical protein